jgi:hypothetical protein
MRRSGLLVMVVAAGCGLVTPAAAVPRCLYISGTADALRKPKAVEDSLVALKDAITKWKTDNGITGVIKQTAQKPEPHPYWRSTVAPDLFLPPDVPLTPFAGREWCRRWFAPPPPKSAGSGFRVTLAIA